MFMRAFLIYFLEGQWLKTRIGETIWLNRGAAYIESLPEIDFVAPRDNWTQPLRRFIEEWHGGFRMGAGLSNKSNADDAKRVGFNVALDGACEMYMQCFRDCLREESLHVCDDCRKVRMMVLLF